MASRSSSVGFPSRGGKGVVCLFEETSDGFRRHGEMKLTENLLKSRFLGYSRAGAVEDRDDDDQSDSVGEGELRVLGALGEAAIATVARAALSVSSLNLISIAESGWMGRYRRYNLGMKKSSIDGKLYLDYL